MADLTAQIINLSEHRSTLAFSNSQKHDIEAEIDKETGSVAHRRTTLEDLYGIDDTNRLILAARAILHNCDRHISAAIDALGSDSKVDADLEASRAFAIWPELFLCRSISDGFGALVLGIYYAFVNAKSDAFSSDQLLRLNSCLSFLKENPFVGFDAALDVLDGLEAVGLRVDPPEANALSLILAEG